MTRALLRHGLAPVLAAALCTASHSAAAAPPAYTVTDLGTLNGGPQSIGYGLNNSGSVVGIGTQPGGNFDHGFLFSYNPASPPASPPSTPLTDVDTSAAGNVNARAINAAGLIVGYAPFSGVFKHAFVGTPNNLTDLGTLGGDTSVAFGINGAGQVVGGADTGASDFIGNPVSHAFHTGGAPLTAANDLGALPNYSDSAAYGVSANGQIVGSSFDFGLFGNSTATLFTPGAAPRSLVASTITISDAYAANSLIAVGDANGTTQNPSFGSVLHPVLFSLTNNPAGPPLELGLVPGFTNGAARSVNINSQIVGTDYNTDAKGNITDSHGFVRFASNALFDLNDTLPAGSGFTVLEANAINDYSQIAADGLDSQGRLHALLLSLTPAVDSISPSSVAPNQANVALSVSGNSFSPDTVIYYNGAPLATTFVSSQQLTATIFNTGTADAATVDVGSPTPSGSGRTLLIGFAQVGFNAGGLSCINRKYTVSVTFTNKSTVPANNVRLVSATLRAIRPRSTRAIPYLSYNGPSSSTLPPNSTQTGQLTFLGSTLPAGTTQAVLQVQYSFAGGDSQHQGNLISNKTYINPPPCP